MNEPLRQRQPRVRDAAYMGWVAQLPCVACAVMGQRRRGVHVAHLRLACEAVGKRQTGMAEKPSDCWTTPLCPGHHMNFPNAQHNVGEERFWAICKIDPFQLCIALYDAFKTGGSGDAVIAAFVAKARGVAA